MWFFTRLPKKLNTFDDIVKLHDTFCKTTGYSIPFTYFITADCYGLKVDDRFVCGFVLKSGSLYDLRAFQELPIFLQDYYFKSYDLDGKTADLTGLFIKNKKYSFLFSIYMLKVILFYKAKYFIYSYDLDNLKLKKHYSLGNTNQLYEGYPNLIHGYIDQQPPVSVDICTKAQVAKYTYHKILKLFTK